jgi:hypothetical protein
LEFYRLESSGAPPGDGPTVTSAIKSMNEGSYANIHGLGFFTRPSGGTLNEYMRITSTGNVGIGTTSPGAKLTVSLAAESVVPSLGASSTFLNIVGSNAYGIIAGVLGSGKTYLQSQRIDGTATAYDMLLQPNGGKVGIGTDSPGSKLDVAGDIETDSVKAQDSQDLVINGSSGTGNVVIVIG